MKVLLTSASMATELARRARRGDLVTRYMTLVLGLRSARQTMAEVGPAGPKGGPLCFAQETEAEWSAACEDVWEQLSEAEQQSIETWLEESKGP